MAEIKAFNKWSTENIVSKDEGLKAYMSLKPVVVPRSGARYAQNRFHKSKILIIERLMNKLMVPGHRGKKHIISSGQCSGKANKVYKIVEDMLRTVESKTKNNPMQVFVTAIENAAPREEITTIEYGGARYPKVVECAPQRRIDLALKNMVQGSYQKAFNSKKTMTQALSEEIIAAFNLSNTSNAISKKMEVERQADSSR